MKVKENPYDDIKINIKGGTIRLSELTEDERYIYFSGVDDGVVKGIGIFSMGISAITLLIFIIYLVAKS